MPAMACNGSFLHIVSKWRANDDVCQGNHGRRKVYVCRSEQKYTLRWAFTRFPFKVQNGPYAVTSTLLINFKIHVLDGEAAELHENEAKQSKWKYHL